MRRKNMKKTAALFLLSVGVNCMTAQDIVPVHEFDISPEAILYAIRPGIGDRKSACRERV